MIILKKGAKSWADILKHKKSDLSLKHHRGMFHIRTTQNQYGDPTEGSVGSQTNDID